MLLVVSSLAVAMLFACLVMQRRCEVLRRDNLLLQRALEEERFAKRILEHELQAGRELTKKTEDLVDKTRLWLAERFETLSQDAFFKTQRTFFDMAKQTFDQYQTHMTSTVDRRQSEVSNIIVPLKTSLEQMEKKVHELEVARKGAYDGLSQQLQQLVLTQAILQKETGNLAKALREPTVRGRWGEIQLRRVVEVAGMLSYCDFAEQVTVSVEDGTLRPDMIVKLPNDRIVVVDSKVSLAAYLDAVECQDADARHERLCQHAKYLRQHIVRLAQKKYWDQFDKTPDFVVLFLHGDCFLAPALEHDADLLEFASAQRVLLATPMSLIAMLKVIAYSWGEAKLEQNAELILQEARGWLERCQVFSEHLADVGKHLERGVKAYDKVVASYESRFLVSLRRLAATGLPSAELLSPPPIQQYPAMMQEQEGIQASRDSIHKQVERSEF